MFFVEWEIDPQKKIRDPAGIQTQYLSSIVRGLEASAEFQF